ncbi:DUF6477 family protein [Cognatiyoonia sp. IB215446]|uniref:DUF6477 family protein n=1 Tax=Cognatiyoonia sp. IB215446 TaxID=3097355 RepID=UPI002A133D18|nr:DUF6477 family protein [Cognatiyoonia sp. IB215446]MDX8349048.1 DUF6477 family protein [Cognatiyoonia sp. IB215446]
MLDIQTRLHTLKRPKLLARSVRFGLDDYRREVHLRRLLQCDTLPRPAVAIMRLFDLESEMNGLRVAKSGNYAVAKHVEILIALAGEAQLLQTATPDAR